MKIEPFFDPDTFTLTYVVWDETSRDAVVIDPVLDYDAAGATTRTTSLEKLAAFVDERKLTVHYALETHPHADHLSGAQWLARRYNAKVAIGRGVTVVQSTFRTIFDMPPTFALDGSQFDELIDDGQTLTAGTIALEAIATPGHTPACLTFRVADALFTGDALFIEDYGTGRCDFPRGDARALYTSVHDRLYAYPDATRVFVGHDYQPGGRALVFETTIGAEKRGNIQLKAETTEADFVAFRNARDATLSAPRLLWPSVQVNIDAGRLPATNESGIRHLRIPFNLKRPTDDAGRPLT
jgi:glyoxylase-like metal-dependent hydrolase (beta-lactamase superfamily II)